MAEPESNAASGAMHWDTLGAGADLWATVVMASGFVLPAGQEVREHYRIVRPLGEGGMGQVLGVVLLGSADPQTYALKMVARPSGDAKPMDAADRRDAENQAKAFAALLRGEAAKQELVQRHGVSVARLFALVRFEDGALGLRMEVARGRSLEAFVEDDARNRATQPPDVDVSLVVMRKVLYQLRRLHELVDPSSPSGFVHSDIKPGNVFVDDGDRYDPFVTLLDFGVSTAGAALDHGRATFAASRKTLILNDAGGTFGFAPPHHFTGKPTPLSDVFAALVILYELITLQSPWDFAGLPKTPANLFKLEAAMRKGSRPVRSLRESIPADVAAVLDRFFTEEFAALHELADAAHEVRSAPDLQARRDMSDRLRALAKSYQTKIEALRVTARGGAPLSDPGMRLSTAETSESPLPAVPRKPPPVPPRRSAFSGDAAHADVLEAVRTDPTYIAGNDDPVRVPTTPLIGWRLLLFLVLLMGGAAYLWFRGVPSEVQGAASAVVAWTHDGPPNAEHTEPVQAVVPTAAVVAHVDASTPRALASSAVDVPHVTAHVATPLALVLDAGSTIVPVVPAAVPLAVAAVAETDAGTLAALVFDAGAPELEPDVTVPVVAVKPVEPVPQFEAIQADAGAAIDADQRLVHPPVPNVPAAHVVPARAPVNQVAARVAPRPPPARPVAHAPAPRPRATHAAPVRRRAPANARRRPAAHPVRRAQPASRSLYGPRRR